MTRPARGKVGLGLAVLAATGHLLLLSSAPLLHTCGCGPAGSSHWASSADAGKAAGTLLAAAGQDCCGTTCLACVYLHNNQSSDPSDPAKALAVPAAAAPAGPALSDVSPWLVLFDYPARAPPALA